MAHDPGLPDPDSGAGALVVLPTFNEADNLAAVIQQLRARLPAVQMLVVDDASPDGTGALADGLARGDAGVHVLHRQGPRGLGLAYCDGFAWALSRPDVRAVFEMDADLSHRPEDLPRLIAALADWDVVLGCRYMPGGGVQGWGWHRRLLSRGGVAYARAVLGLPYRDLTGGFKGFRRSALERLSASGALSAIRSRGYAFQIEGTWRAWQLGLRIGEVPIVFPDRVAGDSKLSAAILHEALWQVLRLRWSPSPAGGS